MNFYNDTILQESLDFHDFILVLYRFSFARDVLCKRIVLYGLIGPNSLPYWVSVFPSSYISFLWPEYHIIENGDILIGLAEMSEVDTWIPRP